ncbi:MAG: PAAR domain-containing protein [Treponema sp.]|jgi:uncharacterized Zn-binding protein involved in type VI secretion|nr:PAAR domain-containing protein [Treponema sp.]
MPGVARLNDQHSGICDHGAPCCPHNVSGPIVSGSGNTFANGRPAARLGDSVTHNCPHCGTGYISSASGTVIVNGKGVARLGDAVTYPGGSGNIVSASGNDFAGG